MKKVFVAFLLIVILAGGGYWVSRQRLTIGVLEGKTERVKRGDLIIPITASGQIEPASITNIKSEASGEVERISFEIGSMVKAGELIVELDEDDEQRSLVRAKSDEQRARMTLEKAKIAKEQAETVGRPLAEATLDQAKARAELAKETNDFFLREREHRAPLELAEAKTSHVSADAQVKVAEAEVVQARIAIEMAGKDIKTAEETLKTATKTWEDAEERLRETKILAPIDGMILSQQVRVGEMVQSATQSFTGGTPLLQLADVSRIYAAVNVDEADIGKVRELAPPSAVPGPTATRPAYDVPAATRPAGGELTTLPAGTFDLGAEVEVTVESFQDEKFRGVIERISPQSELVRAIATFKVWIRITSDNREKLVGLLNTQAEAEFTSQAVSDALLVNLDATSPNPDGEGFGVYVPVQVEGKAVRDEEFRPCKFGESDGIYVEVLEGLEEGDEVYVKRPLKSTKQRNEEQRRADEEGE